MKALFFGLVAAGLIMLSACGKDSNTKQVQTDTTSQTANLLIGKWYYSTDSLKYYTGNKLDSSKAVTYSAGDNILFNASFTGTQTRGGIMNSFKYTYSKTQIAFVFSGTTAQNSIHTDGLRTLAASGTTIVADIDELSTTNLTLTFQTVSGASKVVETSFFFKIQ